MRRGALEIKAVAALQMVLLVVESDLQFAAQHEEELLAFVCVGLATASLGRDAEQVRLHYFVTPGEQLHAHAGTGFEHLALGRTHQSGIRFRRIEKIKDVGAVVACQSAQGADGGAHLRAFERTEEANRNSRPGGDFGETDAALSAQPAQSRANRSGAVAGGWLDDALALERLHDSGGV